VFEADRIVPSKRTSKTPDVFSLHVLSKPTMPISPCITTDFERMYSRMRGHSQRIPGMTTIPFYKFTHSRRNEYNNSLILEFKPVVFKMSEFSVAFCGSQACTGAYILALECDERCHCITASLSSKLLFGMAHQFYHLSTYWYLLLITRRNGQGIQFLSFMMIYRELTMRILSLFVVAQRSGIRFHQLSVPVVTNLLILEKPNFDCPLSSSTLQQFTGGTREFWNRRRSLLHVFPHL
jgi:hypothetical protein